MSTSISWDFCELWVEQVDVARQLGTNLDPEDAAMVSERAEVDEKKAALADAFARKARALAEMETLSGNLNACFRCRHCCLFLRQCPFF